MPELVRFRVLDVRPVPAGWRNLFVDRDTGLLTHEPLPGWLLIDLPDGLRMIVAGTSDGLQLIPAVEVDGFWQTIGPDEALPDRAKVLEFQRHQLAEHGPQLQATEPEPAKLN